MTWSFLTFGINKVLNNINIFYSRKSNKFYLLKKEKRLVSRQCYLVTRDSINSFVTTCLILVHVFDFKLGTFRCHAGMDTNHDTRLFLYILKSQERLHNLHRGVLTNLIQSCIVCILIRDVIAILIFTEFQVFVQYQWRPSW